jgi:hypothetical protein
MAIKTHEVSYKQCCYIHALQFRADWTFQKIASNQGLSVSIVFTIRRGPATPKKKKGRPGKIDTPTCKALVQRATLNTENRRKPLFQIAFEKCVNASQETIRRAFLNEGYVRRIARKKVYLTAAYKMRRLEFARRHQNWTVTDWRKTIWTDECYIWLSGSAGKTYITRKTGNSIQYNNR